MKKLVFSLAFAILACSIGYTAEPVDQQFTFAIARVLINEGPVSDHVKIIEQKNEGITAFLEFLEKNTTIKVNKEVAVVTFKHVEDIEKYPFIFLSANGPILFSDRKLRIWQSTAEGADSSSWMTALPRTPKEVCSLTHSRTLWKRRSCQE